MWPGLWLSLRPESELSVYMVRVQLVTRVRTQYVNMASASANDKDRGSRFSWYQYSECAPD